MLTGTVIGAASLIGVMQPAVSRTITLLGLQLGFKLFEQHGQRLHPTFEDSPCIARLKTAYRRRTHRPGRTRHPGTVHVASLPALSFSVPSRTLNALLEPRPSVTATMQSRPSRQIAELVSTGQFDIGLVELTVSRAAIVAEPLELGSSMLIIALGYRLATQKSIKFSDLHQEQMVLL